MKYSILNTVFISTDQDKNKLVLKGLQEETESIWCFQIRFSL